MAGLARGSLGESAWRNQHNVVALQPVVQRDGGAHGLDDLSTRAAEVADLGNNHDVLFLRLRIGDREHDGAARAEEACAVAAGSLDVLRIVVLAANDERVLEATADEDLALVEKAEIARAQEGRAGRDARLAGIDMHLIGKLRLEVARGQLSTTVVADRHARRRDPELAHGVGREKHSRLGMDSKDMGARGRSPAPHKLAGVRNMLVWIQHLDSAACGQGRRQSLEDRELGRAAGHVERCLGHAVEGLHVVHDKAALAKRLCKAPNCARSDRLGAVEKVTVGKVQGLSLLWGDLADTELVGKVGRRRQPGLVVRNGLEPEERRPQKRQGRHHHHLASHKQALQHATNKSQIVVGWDPCDAHIARSRAHCIPDEALIRDNVVVGDGDALGVASRAGGELDKGDVARRDCGRFKRRAAGRQGVGADPLEPGRPCLGAAFGHLCFEGEDASQGVVLGACEDQAHLRQLGNVGELGKAALEIGREWRVDGHSNATCKKAAHEPDEKLWRLLVDKQHMLALHCTQLPAQRVRRCNDSRPEITVGPGDGLVAALVKPHKSELIRVLQRRILHKRGKVALWRWWWEWGPLCGQSHAETH
eukprot:m.274378 g.274378  ORF g.274378 m.274378 type:complete len:592 (-) comp11091_c1_seq4:200-1975(-)